MNLAGKGGINVAMSKNATKDRRWVQDLKQQILYCMGLKNNVPYISLWRQMAFKRTSSFGMIIEELEDLVPR